MKKLILLLALALCLFSCSKDDNTTENPQSQPIPVTISNVSTNFGDVNDPVVITGTGFSGTASNNIVKFGNVAATVTAATTTSLTVSVPNNATRGKINVQVGTLNAVSTNDFTATSFIDIRDGKEYKQVILGNQVWMAENLNYDTASGDYCYNDNAANCTANGKLYTWTAAQTVAPAGWSIPSVNDTNTLILTLGGAASAKTALIVGGSSGMNMIFTGVREPNGGFGQINTLSGFWTSVEFNTTSAYSFFIYNSAQNPQVITANKGASIPIRCFKNL
jgi:uncharacterized protein (TIGR02145 family)